MEPQIIQKEAFSVVGVKLHCFMGQPNDFSQLWGQLFGRMGEIENITEQGISYGVMDAYDESTGGWDYIAAFSVDAGTIAPEGMVKLDIPAATYAVFSYTMPTIQETYDMIYQQWLPQSVYEHAHTPELERYGMTFNPEDPNSQFEIYVPVTRK
ncbi:MAG: GyrI-like domain-containing protein [Anaerolineae bacterium]|jgi:AraC family transcriptional regulator|nr:GyrI-like domain-containing protein [Anaerolineae bacterium]